MPVLDNQPSIHPGNEWLFDAFMCLDTCRQIGMAMGPIPWDACDRYAERLDDWQRSILWPIVHRADTLFRAELDKRKPA
jgi:hypothetical protein